MYLIYCTCICTKLLLMKTVLFFFLPNVPTRNVWTYVNSRWDFIFCIRHNALTFHRLAYLKIRISTIWVILKDSRLANSIELSCIFSFDNQNLHLLKISPTPTSKQKTHDKFQYFPTWSITAVWSAVTFVWSEVTLIMKQTDFCLGRSGCNH